MKHSGFGIQDSGPRSREPEMHDPGGGARDSGKRSKLVSLNPESRILNPTAESRILNPAAGFTLFEMLLSISLIGLLMVTLLIGLRVANRAWQKGEARLRLVHAAAERNAFFIEQIASLVPYRVMSTDPQLPGRFTVLQSSATCLRFISSYSSVYRSRAGLVLVEYGIVETSRANVEVALRETPVGDNDALFHRLVRSVTNDPETGLTRIDYQPFLLRTTDLPLMTGLRAARFEYLELRPKKGTGPVWQVDWQGSVEAPYPEAIRLRWERGDQEGELVIPVRAKFMLRSSPGQ